MRQADAAESCPLCSKPVTNSAEMIVVSGKEWHKVPGFLVIDVFFSSTCLVLQECYDSTKTETSHSNDISSRNRERCPLCEKEISGEMVVVSGKEVRRPPSF